MTIQGLTSAEALTRQSEFGLNELPEAEKRSFFRSVATILREPMVILLVAAGCINLVLAEPIDAVLLSITVVIIIGISIYQERRTERALSALRDLTAPMALVLRDGLEVRIPSSHVVAGDVLLLHEGDRICADARVISSTALHIDESLLTGESIPVGKTNDDQVFAGSLVVNGHARVLVEKIGTQTKIGEIGKSLTQIPFLRTRLQREVDKLVKVIGILGFVAVALVIIIYGSTRGDWLQGALAGIAAAMALIPEEFPVILTIFLAIGAWRMSKERVIARRSAAIETLGSITALCVDKTGTLTMNQMTVSQFHINGSSYLVEDQPLPDQCREISRIASLAAPIAVFDPMDKAFRALSETFLDPENLTSLREYPLEKDRLAYIHIWRDGEVLVAAKGAPEEIGRLCRLSDDERHALEKEVMRAADSGYRILAIARGTLPDPESIPTDPRTIEYRFLGLALLRDPIRSGVIEAVRECHAAGVRTIMITGDHRNTAIAIAREIGLQEPEKALTGIDIERMSDGELSSALKMTNVFARVAPEHKLRLVRALQENGEVVGMTGDGVNDAPALRAAEIGIAMGGRGTDVAREAAALIITDDNFTSIVAGIRSGRTIYSNLQKAMTYVIAIHIPIFGMALAPVFQKSWPLILLPALVAFHEIIIDPACSVVFEEEPSDPEIMARKPRPLKLKMLNRREIVLAVAQGLSVFIGVLATFLFELSRQADDQRVRSMTFGTLMISNLLLILINRSHSLSTWRTLRSRRNPSVIWITVMVFSVLAFLFGVPAARNAFRLETITVFDFATMCLVAATTLIWFEIWKIRGLRNKVRI